MKVLRAGPARLTGVAMVIAALVLPWARPAAADGEFLQLDLAPQASSFTGSVRRGPVSVSLGWSEFAAGEATTLWTSYGIFLGDGAWLRAGPSLRIDATGATAFGAGIGIERFAMGSRTSRFALAEFNSIQHEYLLLGEIGHIRSGLAGAVSVQGNNAGFREQSLAVSYRLAEGPFRLRAGYRFNAGQAFVGFTINTF